MRSHVVIAVAVVLAATAVPAGAQGVEIAVLGGWTLADGVTGETVESGDGNRYNRIEPKDSRSWGLATGIYVGNNAEVGFLFGQQKTTLQAKGTDTRDIDRLNINTYHPYFAYNFGELFAPIRPYVLVGIGATTYSDLSFTTADGQTRSIAGETRLSTTVGGGLKAYMTDYIGVRLGVQWTPTYIKSDAVGWWCDPFWGCYVVGNAQYANQFQLSGGVTVRF